MQDDISDGARWLVDRDIADPERMCIVGWSYGGYTAAMATIKTPDLFQCAVTINGVLNLVKLIADDHHYLGASSWTRHIGLEGESVKAVSPYHRVDEIAIPLLIIQSEDDTRVSSEHASDMAKALRKRKKPYKLVEIELGGHSMTNADGRLQILQATEGFLAEYIGAGM